MLGYSVYEGPCSTLGPVPKALGSNKEWHRKFPQYIRTEIEVYWQNDGTREMLYSHSDGDFQEETPYYLVFIYQTRLHFCQEFYCFPRMYLIMCQRFL